MKWPWQKVVEKTFRSPGWDQPDLARRAVKKLAKTYALSHSYKYHKIMDIWSEANATSGWCEGVCICIYSNDPFELVDPTEEVVRTILQEAQEIVPGLLLHPNRKVRDLVSRVMENKNVGS
jgi:hypothetical protein